MQIKFKTNLLGHGSEISSWLKTLSEIIISAYATNKSSLMQFLIFNYKLHK